MASAGTWRIHRLALAALALFAVSGAPALAAAPECEIRGPVRFGGLNWDSNSFHTEVARRIVEAGYGCRTEVVPGTTLPLHTGLGRGDVDVIMEIWTNVETEPWARAEAAGTVTTVGVNFPDAREGWYVPRYLIEGDAERGIKAKAPELKSVFDLPKYKALFRDPENPDKGRFHNCVYGWLCEVNNTKKLKVYGLEDHYTNYRVGSGAALSAAMAAAYKRGQPFLSYYWSPTRVMAIYDLVKLEEPPFDQETWDRFLKEDNPEKAVASPQTPVKVGVNTRFQKSAPKLIAFLSAYRTSNDLINEALLYLEENRRTRPEDAAERFLREHEGVWTTWVPADVAARVKADLKD